MTILVPMPSERFDDFVAWASKSHASDNVASGRRSAPEAESLARAGLLRLLPDGFGTADHFFYDIVDEPQGDALGFVWLGFLPRDATRIAYLFQLLVFPQHRRRGHARAALAAVDALARERHITTVALNVFGSNLAAQELYKSFGYVVTSMSMQRELAPNDAA